MSRVVQSQAMLSCKLQYVMLNIILFRLVANQSEVLMSEGKAQLWTIGGMNCWKDLLCLSSVETATTALEDVAFLMFSFFDLVPW